MDKMFEQRKRASEERTEALKQKMDEIVRQEREAGNNRLGQLKADVDDYLEKISQESDARIFQDKLNAINQLIENHKKNLEGMNSNWSPDLQNKFRISLEKLLKRGIQDIMGQKYDLEKAKQEYYPDTPKK